MKWITLSSMIIFTFTSSDISINPPSWRQSALWSRSGNHSHSPFTLWIPSSETRSIPSKDAERKKLTLRKWVCNCHHHMLWMTEWVNDVGECAKFRFHPLTMRELCNCVSVDVFHMSHIELLMSSLTCVLLIVPLAIWRLFQWKFNHVSQSASELHSFFI